MTPETVAALVLLVDWVSRLGFTGGLVLIVVGAFKEWWVPGSVHRRVLGEANGRANMWQGVAMELLGLARRGTHINEALADKIGGQQ